MLPKRALVEFPNVSFQFPEISNVSEVCRVNPISLQNLEVTLSAGAEEAETTGIKELPCSMENKGETLSSAT